MELKVLQHLHIVKDLLMLIDQIDQIASTEFHTHVFKLSIRSKEVVGHFQLDIKRIDVFIHFDYVFHATELLHEEVLTLKK